MSQSLVCDLTVCPALFNPCAADFVAKLLPQLPSIQQTSALTGSEDILRLCKTGIHSRQNQLVEIVIKIIGAFHA